jgi:predicted hydrocarbon binding protein
MPLTSEASRITVKGSPVKSLLKFIDRELTPEQRDHVFAKMPEEYAERFKRGSFLVTETLPVGVLNRMTEEAAIARAESMESFARRAGRSAAEEALTGVYRLFAKVMTPTALLSRAGKVWGSLYARGSLVVTSEESHRARLRLEDFPTEPAMCARITGWIERLTEMTGSKNPRVNHDRCMSRGADACEWQVYW